MRLLPFLAFLLIAVGCNSQNQNQSKSSDQVPLPAASLKDIHWQLRDLLRMQLPATYPGERNGQSFKKSYSIDYQWKEEEKNFLIEVPEKRLDLETEQVTGGSRYFISFENVDVNAVRIIFSEDEKLTALLIPAKKGKNFTYHPFGNEPDEPVDGLTIGWYDRVQDRTLNRALSLWQQFLAKMSDELPK